ncbi:MAG: RNA methyltransferase [Candidatus Delongbacteria bacterium]|nr:RNA methyltransferase [Candidatus Delongbacteria bacterium]
MSGDSRPTQPSRAQLKTLRSLKRRQQRLETGLFLVEGVKNVRELLQSRFQVELLLHLPTFDLTSQLPRLPACPCHPLPASQFEPLCDTVTPEGILAVVRLPRENPAYSSDTPAVYLDGISDPGNLGTIIRTADWFGLQPVVLSHDTVDPFSSKVIRASMGSLFHLPLLQDTADQSLLLQLQREGRQLVGLSQDATAELDRAPLPAAPLLVFGSESHGIRPETAARLDLVLRIQGQGLAESLNVAQAFTIAAYQWQIINKSRDREQHDQGL